MKLTAATRDKLTAGQFALPGGRYPIPDKPHAVNAKARATQQFNKGNLSAADKATVNAKANTILGALQGKAKIPKGFMKDAESPAEDQNEQPGEAPDMPSSKAPASFAAHQFKRKGT